VWRPGTKNWFTQFFSKSAAADFEDTTQAARAPRTAGQPAWGAWRGGQRAMIPNARPPGGGHAGPPSRNLILKPEAGHE